MPFPITIAPNPLAQDKLRRKSIVPSAKRTAEWERMPVEFRERAQFSAGVESARFLSAIQEKLEKIVGLQKEKLANGKDATISRSDFISDLRKVALSEGLQPQDGRYGGLQDPTSLGRLGLVYDMQTESAQGYATHTADMGEGAIDAFPAYELVRQEDRKTPRNWTARWREAGGTFYGGRMIALKTDDIWTRINRFGVPWPPFDFGSGMGLEDVDRRTCEKLGLLARGQKVAADVPGFNDGLKANVGGIGAELRAKLGGMFGGKAAVHGDDLQWEEGT
jgi:hypothetical protein